MSWYPSELKSLHVLSEAFDLRSVYAHRSACRAAERCAASTLCCRHEDRLWCLRGRLERRSCLASRMFALCRLRGLGLSSPQAACCPAVPWCLRGQPMRARPSILCGVVSPQSCRGSRSRQTRASHGGVAAPVPSGSSSSRWGPPSGSSSAFSPWVQDQPVS